MSPTSRTVVVVVGGVMSAAWIAAELRARGMWTWTATTPDELRWVMANVVNVPNAAVVDVRTEDQSGTNVRMAASLARAGIPTILLGTVPQGEEWMSAVAAVLPAHATDRMIAEAVREALPRDHGDDADAPTAALSTVDSSS